MKEKLEVLLDGVDRVDLEIITPREEILKARSEVIAIMSDTKIVIGVPIVNGRLLTLSSGKRLKVIINRKDSGLHQFRALVLRRGHDESIPTMELQRISEIEKIQRRFYFRMPLILDMKLKIAVGERIEKMIDKGDVIEVTETDYIYHDILTNDISGGGLRATIKTPLELGKLVKVELLINNVRHDVNAEVVRCNLVHDVVTKYDLGLRFYEIDEHVRSKIISYIFEKQRKLREKGMV